MGSESDAEVMDGRSRSWQARGIAYEVNVLSAHRDPEAVREYSLGAEARGLKVIIAGAGKAAALPGVVASMTDLPVIGVPIRTSDLGGLDSLLSMVQMPSGRAGGHRGHQRCPQRRHPGREDPARVRLCGAPAAGSTAGGSRSGGGRRRRRRRGRGTAMILRYSTPEMAALWTDEARMPAWLEVEMAVCEAWAKLGGIPGDAMAGDQAEGRVSTSTA